MIEGSRAFVAVLEPGLSADPDFALLGDPERRNAGVALVPERGRLLLLSHLDFPKTHDADADATQAYSRAALHEVVME